MKLLLARLIILLAVLISCLLPTMTALAISPPDLVPPTIVSVYMYQNVLQAGDTYLIAKYYMKYTTNPADPISVSFIARLYQVVIDIGAVSPYPYVNKGYDRGVFSMYWPAGTANAPVWQSNTYTLSLESVPGLNWTSNVTPATMGSGSFTWRTSPSMALTTVLMGTDLVNIATELTGYWNVALLAATAGGVNGKVFTSSGESYFTSSVPGLRSIVPSLFGINSNPNGFNDATNTQAHVSTLVARRASLGLYEGTVGGVPTSLIYAIIALIISILLAAAIAAMLAPLGGAVSQVGGGVVGVGLVFGFVPLLFVYIGTLAAVVYGVMAFIAIIAIGLWLGSHVGRSIG